MNKNESLQPKAGAQVGAFHVFDCGGRLNRITTYGADVVNCDKCGSEYPVEEQFGSLLFAEQPGV